jgi:hypothetical protein
MLSVKIFLFRRICKNIYCYLLFFITLTLITSSSVFAANTCNVSGVWVAMKDPVITGFGLLQEDEAISGWWAPYTQDCDRPAVVGHVFEDGEIIIQGLSQNGCPVMGLSARLNLVTCDIAVVDLWSTYGDMGRFLFQKLPSHIAFTEPKENSVFIISKEPKMPDIKKAAVMIENGDAMKRFINQAKSSPFTWRVGIEYDVKPGREIRSYIPAASTVNKEYQIDFSKLQDINSDEAGMGIRGGKLSIVVDYETGLMAKATYEIRGTNPGKNLIEQVLIDPVSRGIACTESSYRHFRAAREGGIGFPIVGGEKGHECGVGLMQLCSPAPYNSSVWNWRENINQGFEVLDKKRNLARNVHIAERAELNKEREAKGLPACPVGTPPPLTPEQEDRETLRRYNCGREYRWEPRDAKDCTGQWVIGPYFPPGKCTTADIDYVNKVLRCKI